LSDLPPGPPIAEDRAVLAGQIAFVAAPTPLATEARAELVARYGECPLPQAVVVVALGGDGFMLETIHQVVSLNIPVYGMNRGSVGFLMNNYSEDDLPGRLSRAQAAELHPLRMHAVTATGAVEEALAFNEVSLLRQLRQASKIRISVDGRVRLEELSCDGVLISTPAGSSAYNLSAHGPIIPLSANLLPLTPISAFRPRRWRGALLPSTADVLFEVLEADKRPTAAVADFTEVRDVVSVAVSEDRSVSVTVLFDPDRGLSERIIAEQFTV
jgi:NAD+ kinase